MPKPKIKASSLTKKILIEILAKRTVTIQDFSNFLQVTPRTLRKYRATGKVPEPDIKEGHFVRWLPRTFEKWQAIRAIRAVKLSKANSNDVH